MYYFMAMYIYASLPKSFGSFYQIQQDNYPFNRIFHKYIQRLVTIGVEKDLDIFSLIGYVEHGLSGDDRLPDTPTGDQTINFRFSIEDEMVENYYRDQDLSNKMVTQMIIRMTIRLAGKYGTSLSRLSTMIDQIDQQSITTIGTNQKPEEINKPAIRIKNQEADKPKTKPPKKKDNIKIKPKKKKEVTKLETDPTVESERLRKKLKELQQKQAELEEETLTDEADDNESEEKVVTTNPHLADFFG